MAINFPDSPSIGDTYTSGGRTWQWDGSVWSGYGNFVDPSILKIDTVNNRVGVNNVSPAADLDVTGSVSVSSDITVQGNLAVGSITDVESNISNLETRPVETKTASYTLAAGDVNKRVVMNSASATTITVNDAVFSAGDTVWIHNIGAGTTTVTAGTATVNTAASLDVAQWEGGSLFFTSASSAIFFPGRAAAPAAPIEPWLTGSKSIQATGLGGWINDPAPDSYWGQRLALSGDGKRMVVGAVLYDVSPLSNNGLVRVLEWNGSNWNQIGDDFNGLAGNDQLGRAVAISQNGNVVVAATPNANTGSGYVLVADYVDGSWVSRTVLSGASASGFGDSVALSSDGTRIVVGSPGDDTMGGQAGAVHVYDWDGSTWSQVGSTIYGENANDDFGDSVAISNDGTRIVVGAPDWYSGNGQGRLYVYEYSGGSWSQKGSQLEGYANGGEGMGTSVAISGDGNRVMGGEPDHSSFTGAIWIWEWSDIYADWVTLQTIDGSAASDRFGISVAMSSDGQRIAASGYGNDDNGSGAGVIRVYDWNGSKFNQVGGDFFRWPGDAFGNNLAMSADGLVVAGGTFLSPFFIMAFAFV